MTDVIDEKDISEYNKVKITFKDGDTVKAIKGWITAEDAHFFHLLAEYSKMRLTIGKAFVVKIRPDFDPGEYLTHGRGGDG